MTTTLDEITVSLIELLGLLEFEIDWRSADPYVDTGAEPGNISASRLAPTRPTWP